MFKGNRKLIIILAALVGLFFIVRWMKSDTNVRTFESELFTLDTAAVATIKLYPKAGGQQEILFSKNGDKWNVSKDGVPSSIEQQQINSILENVVRIKPQRMAAKTSDQWAKYEVSDSTGTRIILENSGGAPLVDLIVGKFSYKQSPYAQQQGGVSGISYVRKSDDDITYATEGFLSMALNRDFDSFRDRTLVKCEPSSITQVRLEENGTPVYALQKVAGAWLLNGESADSTKAAQYMEKLRTATGTKFDNTFSPSAEANKTLRITGDNMDDVVVKAYEHGASFRLNSSLNPSVYFESDSAGVYGQLFGGMGAVGLE